MAGLPTYRELLSLATFLQVQTQTQNRYPTSFDKIKCPNMKTTCHIRLKFFL